MDKLEPLYIAGRNFKWAATMENFPGGSDGKESAYNVGKLGAIPGWKISWRRKWQPTPVFLPGKSHGWKSMVG